MNIAPYNNQLSLPQLLLDKLTNKQQYKDSIKAYVDYLINDQEKTQKGLLYLSE